MSKEDRKRFEEYGLVILTTAVFAVIITAPLGAILVNSLGRKLLTYDGEDMPCNERPCKEDDPNAKEIELMKNTP